MILEIESKPVPLRVTKDGAIMVASTRVPVDTVIYAYRQGETAEEIVDAFDVLKLADVYSIIGYYLDHQEEMGLYIQRREAEAAEIRREIEARFDQKGFREKLLARRKDNG